MTDPVVEPVAPRDAATVVVIRPGPRGVELFCVERHRRSGFLGGAVVFPGGKVDPEDRSEDWEALTTPLSARAQAFAAEPVAARAFAVASLREALEEAAILPVTGDTLDGTSAAALRTEIATPGGPSLSRALRERGLVLDTGRLEALSRWVTPVMESKRFDTRFYVLAMPANQHGAHDELETTGSFWATPEEILARWEAGEVQLAPPTSWTIGLFTGAADLDDAFAVARRSALSPIRPCFVNDGGQMVLVLAGDPLYPEAAGEASSPIGTTRFVLEGGRFVPVT